MAVVHPSDEKLDRYVRGRLGPPGSIPVVKLEQHLFRCTYCVLKAERIVQSAQAMREAICILRDSYSHQNGEENRPPVRFPPARFPPARFPNVRSPMDS